jgi:D-cysteine desulfhydrase family pyridoxal phosphate-dependent enzyme
MKTIQEAKDLISKRPRQSLAFYPTHLHRLNTLSDELGVNLYLKRDDLSGINLFGGNKIRKLEFLLGDAVDKGSDTIITYGAAQSNHAMQTAAACRRCGLSPILYLVSVVQPDTKHLRANLLLDHIFGAEVHIVKSGAGETETSAESRALELGEARSKRLLEQGRLPYIVPMGGASPHGTLGFASGFIELAEQFDAIGQSLDYIFHSTGTGGTLAGLSAGKALIASSVKIVSISASPKDANYEDKVEKLANDALDLLNASERSDLREITVDRGFYAPGYEIPNREGNDAVRYLARKEGVLLDTVYTGKAFAGLLDYVKSKKVPPGSNIVFWHTGGATALFAEKEIIGDLAYNE